MILRNKVFQLATDGVDPSMVPTKELYTGARIPVLGLGTFGSDSVSHEEVANAVREALSLGYRHLDCASVYGNETKIGEVLTEVFDSGVIKREDMWITSKVWNDKHGDGDVLLSCAQTLKDLGLDYLDLYLVHWPFPNFHPPGCDIDSRSPDSRAYIHENYMKTWRQMEHLVEMGLVRHIGTSNMTIPKLELVLRDCRIKPACNEMELHPHFQQPEFFDYVVQKGILPIGFSPIGSPGRPDRDKTIKDTVDIEDHVVIAAADRLGVHPAVICLKWAVQRGQVPIPFSANRKNIISNLKAVTENMLTEKEMEKFTGIDKKCRLIKGHVFLWKDGQEWTDLWDVDGSVTLP
jgi:alcohol dehydrogenase (NADP+)